MQSKNLLRNNTINWLKNFLSFIKTRDVTFWSTLSTFLLVVITLFLALATKEMADVMMIDFKVRNMPVFWVSSPKLEEDKEKVKISFTIRNASDGLAKNTLHNVIFEMKSGQFYVAENIIVKSGNWSKKINQIPFDYVAKATEIIKLHWPIKTFSSENIKSLILILSYDTLFDEEKHKFVEGYVYEQGHNNFDPMTADLLKETVKKLKDTGLINK